MGDQADYAREEAEMVEFLGDPEGFELTEWEARILVRYFDANAHMLPAIGPVGCDAIDRLRLRVQEVSDA